MALLLSLKRTVDLEPGLTTPQVFHVSQNDVGTRLYVGLEQGGTAYTIPENTTAKVQGCNALGEPFEAITATVSASEVYFTITDQDVTQFAGNAKCEVVLTNGTNILGTANFIVAVEASPMGADVPAIYTNPVQAYIEGVVQDYVDDDVLPDVTAAINSKADASDVGNLTELETTDKTSIVGAVNEVDSGKVDINQGTTHSGKALVVNSSGNVEPGDIAIDIDDTLTQQGEAADAKATGDALALKANTSTIAPGFDALTAYTTGQYVYKNGVLYRFTSNHSGAWTGSDAVDVTVGGEVECISEYDSIDSSGFEILPYYINGSVLGPVTPARLFVIPSSKLTDIRFICSISSTKRVGFVDSVANNATVYNGAEYTGTIDITVQNTGHHAYFVVQLFINSDTQQDISVYRAGITVKVLSAVDVIARSMSDDVNTLKDAFSNPTAVDFQNATVASGIIGSSTDKWNTSSGNNSYFVPISGSAIGRVTITANSNLQTIFAFLKTDSHASGTTPDYATGEIRTVIAAGETVSYSVPSDCHFITFVKNTSTAGQGDFTPEVVTLESVIGGLKNTVAELETDVSAVAYLPDECIKSKCISLWNVGTVTHGKSLKNTGATQTDSDYDTSDFIDVTKISLLYGFGGRYCFYDESKTFISGATGVFNNAPTLGVTTGHYVDVPSGAYYFRICELKTGTKQIYAPSLYDDYLKGLISGAQASRKLYCLGDSITKGMYAEQGASSSSGPTAYGYPYWIGQISGYDVVNLGNSGSGWANVGSAESAEDTSIAYNAKGVVDANSFDDADIITLAFGVNDWKGAAQNVVLGDMTSTSGDGTVIGNMKYCIETLTTKKPTAQLIVLLPMNTNRQWSGMATMTLENNWAFGYAYRNNQTLQDYRTAIRQCAEYYNIKVIDLEEVCPINRLNIRNVCGDGLHPTKAFYKQMGQALANLIR